MHYPKKKAIVILEGCETYLTHVVDTEKVNSTSEEIPIVKDCREQDAAYMI